MIVLSSKLDCCGCNACVSSCPDNCIKLKPDSEGFEYIDIDVSTCTNCGKCDRTCPMNKERETGKDPVAYAAWARNEEIRGVSSSGGVFSVLAQKTLAEAGVVFGAAFNEEMHLEHTYVDKTENLEALRGSKYLQSDIANSFIEVRAFLKAGRQVLFSGTPCQIAGLKNFLKQPYENLLTVEVVCHGVVSPKVFKAYKQLREKDNGSKTERIEFRNKKFGWKIFSVVLSFANKKLYSKKLSDDPYMRGFLRNLYLRPACHECQFSTIPRVSDIALGDFWGVYGINKDLDDDKGTSVVLAQTNKGKDFFESCKDELVVHDAKLSDAIKVNSAIVKSALPDKRRESFFRDFNKMPYEKVEKKYMRKDIFEFIKEKHLNIFKILTCAWMCVIFYFSAQTAGGSIQSSSGVLNSIIDFVIQLTGHAISEAQRLQLIGQMMGTVRSCAHFIEYVILGVLVSKSFVITKAGIFKIIGLMLLFCFTYALSDEAHQLFVPGRAFQLEDLSLDCLGSLTGLGLVVGYRFFRYKNKR